MKRGFTLIELMVVVGIMAFLGVAASSGYTALQRGMAERGATAAASSFLQAAKERAMVDRSPTMVFCYNRMLSEATQDKHAVVAGEAVAVRRAGRVSYATGDYIVDEFMDVVGSYDIVEQTDVRKRKGMKLWRFDDRQNNQMAYSVVADAVVPLEKTTLNLVAYDGWRTGESSGNSNMPFVVYGFYNLGKSDNEPSRWAVGNGYGFEFAKMQLPKNFVFEKNLPSKVGEIKLAQKFYFNPENPSGNESINIYLCTPKSGDIPQPGDRPVGQASSSESKKI